MNVAAERKPTKKITIGETVVGAGHPVAIQSMTNTDTKDVGATLAQIAALEAAGCEIVRVSVPDRASARALAEIKKAIRLPLVADIHFKAELAVAAIEAGADKVRINPGNIGSRERVRLVVAAAAAAGIPIRVGVNSGSISKSIRARPVAMAEKLVLSALENIAVLESFGFDDIVVSVKSPDVPEAVDAYRGLAERVSYPLHLGITESGTLETGAVRSAVGLGALLAQGIGDTIRVSLTADPVHEVRVARQILQALNLRRFHPELISCPTCSRCEVDLIPVAEKVEAHIRALAKPIKIAVMGCVVNGPGEAQDADIGLAAGRGKGVIFLKGRPIMTVDEGDFAGQLMRMIDEF